MKVRIGGKTKDIRAIWMEGKVIKMIDQRVLPHKFKIYTASNRAQLEFAIKDMVVRGAPAIGAAAAYGVCQAALLGEDVTKAVKSIKGTRPTAYDLFYAADKVSKAISDGEYPLDAANNYVDDIVDQCKKIGQFGEKLIKSGDRILTHCNAGALATVDYGTALAPMRFAHYNKKKIFVFADETRPRLQGAKLTAWELEEEGIPHAIIADNAAGYYMSRKEIDLAIVGADRITRCGDFANKIGTYEKAVLAKENGIPFYVAAPASTIDLSLESGKGIKIEERSEDEVLYIDGKRIAPKGCRARNPAFDVTPAKYVTGIITDKGVLKPGEIRRLKK